MSSNILHMLNQFQPLNPPTHHYCTTLLTPSIHHTIPTYNSSCTTIKNNRKKFFTTSIRSSNSSSPQPNNDDGGDKDEDDDFPVPPLYTQTYPIEKRRKSAIIRERGSERGVVQPEPPNYEIGWKRTKPIPLEKPTGYVIMDYLEKLEELMGKNQYGSRELLEKVGEIVAERAREEAEVLVEEGKVEERMVTELFRVLKLMEMDLAMVKAAVKDETLSERLEQAKARCRQAILVANSF